MAQESVESIFGINAGLVWKALNKNGPMTISDLMKATALQPEEIYGALGWLSSENKISVGTCGKMRSFSLRP
ncbi:MAG: winged helix-turn-helix domain-containing protein [Methanothrix sp.]